MIETPHSQNAQPEKQYCVLTSSIVSKSIANVCFADVLLKRVKLCNTGEKNSKLAIKTDKLISKAFTQAIEGRFPIEFCTVELPVVTRVVAPCWSLKRMQLKHFIGFFFLDQRLRPSLVHI